MIIVLVDSTVVYNDPLRPRYKRERTKPPLDPAKTPADLFKKKIIFACFKGVNGQKPLQLLPINHQIWISRDEMKPYRTPTNLTNVFCSFAEL